MIFFYMQNKSLVSKLNLQPHPIAQHIAGMRKKYFLAFLQTDGIDNTLALAALQASHDDVP